MTPAALRELITKWTVESALDMWQQKAIVRRRADVGAAFGPGDQLSLKDANEVEDS